MNDSITESCFRYPGVLFVFRQNWFFFNSRIVELYDLHGSRTLILWFIYSIESQWRVKVGSKWGGWLSSDIRVPRRSQRYGECGDWRMGQMGEIFERIPDTENMYRFRRSGVTWGFDLFFYQPRKKERVRNEWHVQGLRKIFGRAGNRGRKYHVVSITRWSSTFLLQKAWFKTCVCTNWEAVRNADLNHGPINNISR